MSISASAAAPVHGLAGCFLSSAERVPSRVALEAGGRTLTYAELYSSAASIAATLKRHRPSPDLPLTAVFAYRSWSAFAGVLGALIRGHGYVPLNRTFPPERTRRMLESSGCTALIVDSESACQLEQVLPSGQSYLILVPDRSDASDLVERFPHCKVLSAANFEPADSWRPVELDPNGIAYLLFTSGSTGTPKGVMVSHRNALKYVEFVSTLYQMSEADRCSQTFDMTFDLSVHDMFVTWSAGACLCCPNQKVLINPGRFVQDARLSVWFSVPSTAVFMKKLGSLKPGAYPNLRLSLFCGEGLPVESVKAWEAAAPNSVIENIYGPTEVTIACTRYRWAGENSLNHCEHGLVPIGESFPHVTALVVDDELRELPDGQEGELLLGGDQVSLGYYNDSAKTARSFVTLGGRTGAFYRTGDLVRRNVSDKQLKFIGRIDFQVKVLGHRVELGEIEQVLREETGLDGVVALGWPIGPSGASGVEAFVEGELSDPSDALSKAGARLPTYMVPRRLHCLPRLPVNVNGKYDRGALTALLKEAK